MERIELVPGFYLEEVEDGMFRVRGPEKRHEAMLTDAEARSLHVTIQGMQEVSNMDGFLAATEALIENARRLGKHYPTLLASAKKVRHEREKLAATIHMQSDTQEVKGTA